jgi:hypothetical protein
MSGSTIPNGALCTAIGEWHWQTQKLEWLKQSRRKCSIEAKRSVGLVLDDTEGDPGLFIPIARLFV